MTPPPRPALHKKKQSEAAPLSAATYPMRINKYLAHKGHATRRDADALIEKGLVFVNGARAGVGDKVNETDTVEVRTKTLRTYIYLAFNKPKDVVTLADVKGEQDIISMLPSDLKRLRLFPLGRLDKASSGLILITNDGRITDRLLNPAYDHEKKYEVTTKMPLRASFAEYMEKGVDIEGYLTKATKVEILGESKFRITLTEGKKHQIRRMVVAMHNEVKDLKRVAIMNIALNNLPVGGYRRIEGKELMTFLSSLGL